MIIGIDFDGTLVKHDFPNIGGPIPRALTVVRMLQDAGHKIILYTMRSDNPKGNYLTAAVDHLEAEGVILYGVNKNEAQKSWTTSPKPYCHIYIGDEALGCPLIWPTSGERPYVDWVAVESILRERGYLLQEEKSAF